MTKFACSTGWQQYYAINVCSNTDLGGQTDGHQPKTPARMWLGTVYVAIEIVGTKPFEICRYGAKNQANY